MIDFDDVPESDPYCAHWISIFDEKHGVDYESGSGLARGAVACETCGHPCTDHPASWGCQCQADDCECRMFESYQWPAETTVRPR